MRIGGTDLGTYPHKRTNKRYEQFLFVVLSFFYSDEELNIEQGISNIEGMCC